MSELEELMKQYCPNGVEYRPLWSLTAWDKKFNAVDRSKQKKVYDYHYFLAGDLKPLIRENGSVKLLTTNTSDLFTDEELVDGYVVEREVVAIPWGGNPNVQYYSGRFVTADNRIATSLDTTVLDNKYLYYYLQSRLDEIASFYRGSGIKHPDMAKVLDLSVPVPPLPVQREIVRILDKFTELEAELEAELQLRKKQYEWHRDQLLTFRRDGRTDVLPWVQRLLDQYAPNGVEWTILGNSNLFGISRGVVISKNYIRDHAGQYPVYSSQTENGGLLGCVDRYAIDGERITWTTDGAKAGTCFYRCGCFNITNVCGAIEVLNKDIINIKFLQYFLECNMKRYVNYNSPNPKLMSNVVATIDVPIPPIQIQDAIVSVLDNFSTLVIDISSGLPAEISARHKQYEYYRDKLLMFEKLGVC